jgi:hypothetical protein
MECVCVCVSQLGGRRGVGWRPLDRGSRGRNVGGTGDPIGASRERGGRQLLWSVDGVLLRVVADVGQGLSAVELLQHRGAWGDGSVRARWADGRGG